MVYVGYIVKTFPDRGGVFGICVWVRRNFDEVHVAFRGWFCVGTDGLEVLCPLFGGEDFADDFLAGGVVGVDAVIESR